MQPIRTTCSSERRILSRMEYTLAHGTANDFVVLADLDDQHPLSAQLTRALCDRRRGVGADGVLRLAPGDGDAQVFMDHRNADGSTAEMCGNGVRVVAKYVVDHGIVAPDADGSLRIGTRSGVKRVQIHRDGHGLVAEVSVDMGSPILDPVEVPFETGDPSASTHEVELPGGSVELSVVSMGNPHGVLLVDDVARAPVADLGARLETHPRFPAKANIGFAQVLGGAELKLRVWERGVGETAACGTGACAAVVALHRRGLVDDEVVVHLPGGALHVSYRPGGTVIMTGPAVEIATGRLAPAWLTHATDPDAR